MKKLILSLVMLLALCISSYAQRTCGTEAILKKAYTTNPNITEESMAKFRAWKKDKEINNRSSIPVTIPVHVIVVHPVFDNPGFGGNLSLERIQSQIDVLNDDFGRTNDDAGNTPSAFEASGTDISFCLATIDPDGNPTDGVTRYPYGGDWYDAEDDIIEETAWDRDIYLNLYTIQELDGLLGYSSLPSPGELPFESNDVVRILASSFGGDGYATENFYDEGRTATHEIGHWLGLPHVWGFGGGGCSQDDGFDDTPIQDEPNYGCPNHPSASCSNGGDMFMNYMDYVNDNCMNSFSVEQGEYMEFIIENTRTSLLTAANIACVPSGFPIVNIVSQTDIQCAGQQSGSIEVTASSGTPPYVFVLDGAISQSNGSFQNLSGGEHTMDITESDGNTTTINFTINEPEPLVVQASQLSSTCPGLMSGSVQINASGGSNGITGFSLEGPGVNLKQETILLEKFDVQPTDWVAENQWMHGSGNSLSSLSFEIPNRPGIMAVNDDGIGSGVNGTGNLISPTITLPADAVTVTVSLDVFFLNGDYNGDDETAKLAVSIDNGATWSDMIEFDQTIVGGAPDFVTYSVDISGFGGMNTMFRIEYNDGGGWNFGLAIDNFTIGDKLDGLFEGLAAGNYTAYSTDGNGCSQGTSVSIQEVDPFIVNSIVPTAPSCNDGNSGSINVDVTSSNGAVFIILNNIAQSSANIQNLASGTYDLLVIDPQGCTYETQVTIPDSGSVGLTLSSVSPIFCAGNDFGAFEVEVNSSNAYELTLNGEVVSETSFMDLPAGDYTLVATTDDGCSASLVVNIPEPPLLELAVDIVQDATCGNNGTVTLQASGGTPPYIYYSPSGLEIPEPAQAVTGLAPGDYSYEVVDANNCISTTTVTIQSIGENFDILFDVLSCGAIPPSIVAQVCNSANLPLSWTLNVEGFGQVFEGFDMDCLQLNFADLVPDPTIPQTLTFEGTSEDGCSSSSNFEYAPPASLGYDNTPIAFCESGTFQIPISNSDEFSSIELNGVDYTGQDEIVIEVEPEVAYTITTVDFAGCTTLYPLDITVFTAPILSSEDLQDATADSPGSATFTVSGGLSPWTFTVGTESNTTGEFLDLPAGEYLLTITDSNGCVTLHEFEIKMESSVYDPSIEANIVIKPIPAREYVYIEIEQTIQPDSYRIFSATGKRIAKETPWGLNTGLSIVDLPDGIYFIEFRFGDQLAMKKFVKQ